jgi:hypothetical protein
MNPHPQYSLPFTEVNRQLPITAVQVIIGTKPMDVLRHRVGVWPKAEEEKTA